MKEVVLHLYFCFYFEQPHFVMFSGLLVLIFVKLSYYTTYFVKKKCTHFFFVFCLTCGLKN